MLDFSHTSSAEPAARLLRVALASDTNCAEAAIIEVPIFEIRFEQTLCSWSHCGS